MVTFLFVVRILFLIIGGLIGLCYLLFQLFQKVSVSSFSFGMIDGIVLTTVSLIFGFGTDSYYGLLACVPLFIIKILCRAYIKPNRVSGSGRWMEVNWKKLTPRGFGRNVPKAVMDEMNRMPQDNHFVIPRMYMLVFVKFMTSKMNKEMGKGMGNVSQGQQQMAMGQFQSLIDSVVNLQKGRTEKKDFPFGVLKVTRL
jgi:hypothetical protein